MCAKVGIDCYLTYETTESYPKEVCSQHLWSIGVY